MKHFQTQRDWKENTDPQHEEEICDFLSNEEKYSINDTTDKPFTISEVKKVKKKIKNREVQWTRSYFECNFQRQLSTHCQINH